MTPYVEIEIAPGKPGQKKRYQFVLINSQGLVAMTSDKTYTSQRDAFRGADRLFTSIGAQLEMLVTEEEVHAHTYEPTDAR